jgi:hypothetical protein
VADVRWTMRPTHSVPSALGLALVLVAAACGDDSADTETGGSVELPPGGDEVVVDVSTVGLPGIDPQDRPDFQMWADGTVLVDGAGPFGIDRYQLSDQGVEEAVDLVADIDLDADHGMTDIVDGTITHVTVNLGGEEDSFRVDQLGYPDDLPELSSSQASARDDLQATLDALGRLVDGELVVEGP